MKVGKSAVAASIKDMMSAYKWKERKVIKGLKNKDKIFFVIRRNSKTVGLFSYVLIALGHIKYAEEKGYIPVIDMKNYISPYLNRENPVNVWEYYFEQPAGYSLDDIRGSRHIMYSSGGLPETFPDFYMFENPDEIAMWRGLFHKYIRMTEETKEYVEQVQRNLFKKERILGVLCRGTDYRELKPKMHPIQPEVEDVIEKVENALKEQNCSKVYLATEDWEILKRFQAVFGEKLLFLPVEMREYKKGRMITEIEMPREDDRRLKGLEYLAQIALLSECCCFIGSGCGGCYGALLMSEGFEWEYLWNLGVYE